MSIEAVEMLAHTPMFAGVSRVSLERLAERARERQFERGELVFCEGAPADAMYVVGEGLIKLFVVSSEGSEMALATLHPGDSFGELAALDGKVRSASAVALRASRLLVLRSDSLRDALHRDPILAETLLLALVGLIRRLTGQRADLLFRDLSARVAQYLLDESRRQGRSNIDLEISQTDLARLVGGSRQSVNSVLRSFEEQDLLRIDGRHAKLVRPDLLRVRAADRS